MIDEHLYRAALEGAALADRSARGKTVANGADRLSYLQAMLTQDIAALRPGRGCYAAYLTAQGRMVADMRVYELGDRALMESARGLAPALIERLEQFVFSEDVQLRDETAVWQLVRIVGPRAPAAVHEALVAATGVASAVPAAEELATWGEFRVAQLPANDAAAVIAATREWGLAGFDLFIRADRFGAALDALGRSGVAMLDEQTAETLRIEAGAPEFLVDMTTETIPLEAGIEHRAISFTKGCYPGQEVIVRVLHRGGGRVAKRLVGLLVTGDTVPERGCALAAGETEVGRVTSAAWSPALRKPIALGYVKSDLTAPGTAVELLAPGGRVPAVTASLPFVAR